ncbi:MAG: hypothetical protein HP493_11330 [Nitrospira sp.]|nr:hypothetical protein [Nitrospira sp.]
MIQSVADANAFNIGRQYAAENRVRIVEADDSQITSAVIGNSGLYEQTIRLKDGHLLSKCSCTLPEEPMCRHCIAVLIEYHRWVQPRQPQKSTVAKSAQVPQKPEPSAGGKALMTQSSAPDVKLSEVLPFLEWLRPALHALETGTAIPDPPQLGQGDLSTWIQVIMNQEHRHRESEEALMSFESKMKDREAYIGRLTQQLQVSIAETKTAQETLQLTQIEVDEYKEILAHVAELAGEVVRHDGKVRAATNELLSKSSQLNSLTESFKDLAESLKSASAKRPSK